MLSGREPGEKQRRKYSVLGDYSCQGKRSRKEPDEKWSRSNIAHSDWLSVLPDKELA